MKLKRTFITPITFMYPLAIIIIGFLIIMMQRDNFIERNVDMWASMVVIVHFVVMVFIPIAITIISSHVINVEHQTNAWKFLFSLPIPKSQLYMSKLFQVIKLCVYSALVMFGGFIVIGMVLGFSGNVPYLLLLKAAFLPYVGALPIMTFQLWMSMKFKNQAFPIGIGILGAISAFFFQMNESTSYLFWAYPAMMTPVKQLIVDGSLGEIVTSADIGQYTILSVIFGLFFLLLGFIAFNNQQVD
nr:ABC transporter permease [Metabacillus iocasae]